MAVSTAIAFLGIGLAAFLWLKNRHIPARLAVQFSGVHTLLMNKYYVDEAYDAAIVQPIKTVSTVGLWRGMDAGLVDGAVNGAGYAVGALAAGLRLLQTGSVKSYAAGTFLGAVAILAYYLWR
jgi:NADH-quinone oxidoreductase subunit L